MILDVYLTEHSSSDSEFKISSKATSTKASIIKQAGLKKSSHNEGQNVADLKTVELDTTMNMNVMLCENYCT